MICFNISWSNIIIVLLYIDWNKYHLENMRNEMHHEPDISDIFVIVKVEVLCKLYLLRHLQPKDCSKLKQKIPIKTSK